MIKKGRAIAQDSARPKEKAQEKDETRIKRPSVQEVVNSIVPIATLLLRTIDMIWSHLGT